MFKKSMWRVWVVVSLLILASMACEFSFSSASIDKAYMAKDQDGNDKASQFAPGEEIYAILELKNAPDDSKMKAIWYTVDVEGEEPNTQFADAEVEGGSGQYYFTLESESALPVGTYKIELALNGEVKKTLNFEVVAQ